MMTVSLPSSWPSSRTSVPNHPLRPVPLIPVPSSPAGSGGSYMRNHVLPSRRSEPGLTVPISFTRRSGSLAPSFHQSSSTSASSTRKTLRSCW